MTTTRLKAGDLVMVATEGGKPGVVAYATADGYYGVGLVAEGGRTDEWPAAMVTACTAREAATAAVRFVTLPAALVK